MCDQTSVLSEVVGRPAGVVAGGAPVIPAEWVGQPFDPSLARDEVLHSLFEAQADARPDAVALECPGDRVTYAELERRANQLAHVLRQGGVGRGGRVAMLLPRGNEVLVALLAILKAGAAYVPLDPDYPADRVSYILGDANVDAVVTTMSPAARHDLAGRRLILLDDENDRRTIASAPTGRLSVGETGVRPSDLCYVIYTSGSTGRPKGVEVEHRNACNLVRAEGRIFDVRPSDRVYQGFSIAFDASVEEVWLAFFAGATLVVATAGMAHAGPALSAVLAGAGVTVLSCVPTLLAMMRDDVPTLRLLILGGESCPADLVRRWARPGLRMVNTYGPTEATVIATWGELRPGEAVTIGRPVPNYRVYLLDAELRPVDADERGELYIGGAGVARGYAGRPDLTAERFVAEPFSLDASDRLYRTGDLGRYLPDGRIEFLGRADTQVKLRGFRVELAEIESALLECPEVLAAAVAVRSDTAGVQQLVGYVVPRPSAPAGPRALEAAIKPRLRSRLPAYMVPGLIEPIDALPTLPSGKVDRGRLPAPAPRAHDGCDAESADLRPTEAAVLRCWRTCFAPAAVAPDDDFFRDLGGHSLLAATMVSRLRDDEPALADVSVPDVYNHPTARGLAAELEARKRAGATAAADPAPPAVAPVPSARYALCGAAQVAGLYVVLALFSVQWLAPYLTYSHLAERGVPALAAVPAAALALLLPFPVTLLAAVAAKWALLGRVRPGRYPLWGWFYFRWWLAGQIEDIVPREYFAGTPLMSWYCRLMGAKVGRNVRFHTDAIGAYDTLSVGDDTTVGSESTLLGYHVEADTLTIGPVAIGRNCYVGTRSVLAPGTRLEDGAALEDLSLLPAGGRVPRGQRWLGSPARPLSGVSQILVDGANASRPPLVKRFAFGLLHAAGAFVFPLIYLAAFLPGMMLMNHLSRRYGGAWYLLASPAVAVGFVVLLCLEIAAVKWLLLGRVRPGRYPVHGGFYLRKWFVDRLMDLSLEVLGPLYATLYLAPWYRLLGARMGRAAEVSTACAASPDLLDLGDESFVADAVSLGAPRYENGTMTLDETRIGRRAFVGNSAMLPAGATVGEGALVGVLSAPPRSTPGAAAADTSWLGSPAIYLPRRQCSPCFGEASTFAPTRRLYAARLAIEFCRVTLPATSFVVLSSLMIAAAGWIRVRWSTAALVALFPALCLGCGVLAGLFVVAAKWVLIGRYAPGERPLWSHFVWRTELITALHENLANPFLVDMLTGTPLAPVFFRLMGSRIGRRVYMETTCLTEFDLIHVGDGACLNADCTLQTHLFEDRVMKMSRIDVGPGCTVGQQAVVLYDSSMSEGATLAELSLLMKGESLPSNTRWQGSPASRA